MINGTCKMSFPFVVMLISAMLDGLNAVTLTRLRLESSSTAESARYRPQNRTEPTSLSIRSKSRNDGVSAAMLLPATLKSKTRECPRVYVYDIPELWDASIPFNKLYSSSPQDIFGKLCPDGTFQTAQYSLSMIILYRLSRSKSCKTTQNPDKADLFIVPTYPRPKGASEWAEACGKGRDPAQHLQYLNSTNAHRHLFILGKGHKNMRACDWWFKPDGLLRRSMRVSYSVALHGSWEEDGFESRMKQTDAGIYGPYDSSEWPLERLVQLKDSNRDDVPYPHTYSVPYPSDIHWHTAAGPGPWAYSSRPRRFLASFVGGMHGEYGLDVRKKIATDCRDAGEPRCLFSSISALPQRGHCNLKAFKQHATFCLEPGGDSPYRKSLSDDITMGCIPVTFSPYLDMVDPWHWGHFRNQSRVYINPQDYLSGKLNLFEHLESLVATGQAEEMQRAIGKHGHTFQYALSDYPGDAVETLLKGAVGEAEDRERLEPQLRSPWR